MSTYEFNGIECNGFYRIFQEGDPEIGYVRIEPHEDAGPGIKARISEKDVFVESPHFDMNVWSDGHRNLTFGRAAQLVINMSREVVDGKEKK